VVVVEEEPDLFSDEEEVSPEEHCGLFLYGPPVTPGLKREIAANKKALIRAFRWDEEKARTRMREAIEFTAKKARKGALIYEEGALDEAEAEINEAHEARDMWRYRNAVKAWVKAWPKTPKDPKDKEEEAA
jgi:hypothetical protein